MTAISAIVSPAFHPNPSHPTQEIVPVPTKNPTCRLAQLQVLLCVPLRPLRSDGFDFDFPLPAIPAILAISAIVDGWTA
jgi:hypothetical protein